MWKGNKTNPVPNALNKDLVNSNFKNVINTALDTRRDNDVKKNFSISLLDIDTALISYLENVITPTVTDGGDSIKVPILYGNPEKWHAAKVNGGLRDQQGKLQIPLIMLKRTSFSRDESYPTFNRYLTYPVITKFTEKNKYEKFSVLNKSVAPVHSVYAVTLPDHVKLEYEFMVWTEYVEQNNAILEKINFAEGDYWGDSQSFKFRVRIENYSNSIESSGEKDRMVRSTFTLSTNAYLLPESFEDRKQTVQKALTPRQINIVAETVTEDQLNKINVKNKPKSLPYYKVGDVISSDKDTWKFPSPTIVSEKSTTVSGEILQKVRQSYSALIQQTIVVSGSAVGGLIWHTPPTSPTDYGEEGWMAYDGYYHYIYANGKWLRQSISEWN